MRTNPFGRALALINALAGATGGLDIQAAMAAARGYKSRGHGKGVISGKKWGNESGKTYPTNGAREVARRQRQIACGMLKVSA